MQVLIFMLNVINTRGNYNLALTKFISWSWSSLSDSIVSCKDIEPFKNDDFNSLEQPVHYKNCFCTVCSNKVYYYWYGTMCEFMCMYVCAVYNFTLLGHNGKSM